MRDWRHRAQRGFNLLEVVIATTILIVTISVFVQVQVQASRSSLLAERVVIGTDLAREKLAEVLVLIEAEGVASGDIHAAGDFDDFGREADLDYDDSLERYEWEYEVVEVDLALSGDLFSMMGDMSEELGGGAGGSDTQDATEMAMASLGISNEQITETLGKFIREVRVRVWWGKDLEISEEKGQVVELVTHVISPKGAFESVGGSEAGAAAPAATGSTGFQGSMGGGMLGGRN